MRHINWKHASIAAISVAVVEILGTLFTSSSVGSTWYNTVKPTLTPPSFVFPLVWNVLFATIVISFYLCLNNSLGSSKKKIRKRIYLAFYLNFFLNVLWTALYFGLRSPALALAEIVLLWASIWFMIFTARKVSKTAAWLLVPYLAWVAFAIVLNALSI